MKLLEHRLRRYVFQREEWLVNPSYIRSESEIIRFRESLEGASSSANGDRLGRGETVLVRLSDGKTALVRNCLRGGFAARLWRDRYFCIWGQIPRPISELSVLGHLHGKVRVPGPIAAAVNYGPLNLSYRGLVVTEYLDGAQNLLVLGKTVGQEQTANGAFSNCCFLAGCEARKMLECKVFHPDLHLGNVLIMGDAAYLIDFDRAEVTTSLDENVAASRLLARWTRSAEKHQLADSAVRPFRQGLFP